MISGNKGFKKQSVSKNHKPLHSGITFRNSRNKRSKKKGSPLSGVAVLPAIKLDTLLQSADEPQLKQQENEMADMKSELTKVISAWEDTPKTDNITNTIPEVPQVEIKSNASVSQTVFDYVRDHPNRTRADVAYALVKRGYNKATVGALVSQFIRQKLFVFGVGKVLIVTRKTYTPMYHKDNKPAPQGIAAIATSAPTISIATQPLITPGHHALWTPPQPGSSTPEWTVESVVDKLNIRQARAVYNELRTLLGED